MELKSPEASIAVPASPDSMMELMSRQLPTLFQRAHADYEDPDWILSPRPSLPDVQHRQPTYDDNADSDRILPTRSIPASRTNFSTRQPQGYHIDLHQHSSRSRYMDEPTLTLPTFHGRSNEWDAFWIQFELLSRRYKWTGDRLVEQLLLSLQGEAATFVTTLSPAIRYDELLLIRALKDRFSHNLPAEAHRSNLSHIKKNPEENNQEYAARIQAIMSKAYPDIIHTTTYEQLLVQHFLRGIPDQQIAYEVLTRQPRTIYDAINLVDWHECCKDILKQPDKQHQVSVPGISSQDENTCISEDRRLSRLVTEEQLQELLREFKTHFPTIYTTQEDPDSNKEIATEILPGYTTKEVEELQRQDQDTSTIHQWFDQRNLPCNDDICQPHQVVSKYQFNNSSIVRKNNILFVKKYTAPGKFKYQLLVPSILKVEVIENHHNHGNRHLGVNKTCKSIREKFGWYLMSDDVRNYIRCCKVCNPKRQ